jgi:hypothetical protein
MHILQLDLSQTYIFWGYSPVGDVLSVIIVVYIWWKSLTAAIFVIRISVNLPKISKVNVAHWAILM